MPSRSARGPPNLLTPTFHLLPTPFHLGYIATFEHLLPLQNRLPDHPNRNSQTLSAPTLDYDSRAQWQVKSNTLKARHKYKLIGPSHSSSETYKVSGVTAAFNPLPDRTGFRSTRATRKWRPGPRLVAPHTQWLERTTAISSSSSTRATLSRIPLPGLRPALLPGRLDGGRPCERPAQ